MRPLGHLVCLKHCFCCNELDSLTRPGARRFADRTALEGTSRGSRPVVPRLSRTTRGTHGAHERVEAGRGDGGAAGERLRHVERHVGVVVVLLVQERHVTVDLCGDHHEWETDTKHQHANKHSREPWQAGTKVTRCFFGPRKRNQTKPSTTHMRTALNRDPAS